MYRRLEKTQVDFIASIMTAALVVTLATLVFKQVFPDTQQDTSVQVARMPTTLVIVEPDIQFVADAEFERMSLLVGTTVFYQGKGYMLLGLTGDTANPCQAMLIGLEGKVNCADIVTEPADKGAQPPAATNLDR